MPVPSGAVLPADVLVQPWFGVFGLFVALNTVIYLGLTAAKFVPWPTQVQPRQVRRILPISQEHHAMKTLPQADLADPLDAAKELRQASAAQTIPIGMALVGTLTVAVGMLYLLLYYADEGPIMLVSPAYGLGLVVLSLVLARRRPRAELSSWLWCVLMLGFIVETSWRATVLDSAVPLAFTLVVLGFTAPISLSWRPGVSVAIVGTLPVIAAGAMVSVVDTISWTLAAVSASIGSLVLLYLRVVALDRLAEEQARANMLASTDPLTGTFSRSGLIAVAPSIATAADQTDGRVSVVLCSIEDLARINADYGFAYGTAVITATSRAFRVALPERAIVSRWEAGSFLAVMTGDAPAAAALQRKVDDNLELSGIALGKTPVRTHVVAADGNSRETTLEELIAEAVSTRPV